MSGLTWWAATLARMDASTGEWVNPTPEEMASVSPRLPDKATYKGLPFLPEHAAAEDAVLERLAALTAEVGSWLACLTLFASSAEEAS